MVYMQKVNELREELIDTIECLLTGNSPVVFDTEETFYKSLPEEDGERIEYELHEIGVSGGVVVLTFKDGERTRFAYLYSLKVEELAELAELLQLYVG
jgi:hypothetical protein